ncbi:MAG: hypothetical protein IT354_02075 [Gemmatimonadaceae bacterium]|jgi:hypothetical protein|nr:hypothetical protein [Gemmatimonadaceae bacterium]
MALHSFVLLLALGAGATLASTAPIVQAQSAAAAPTTGQSAAETGAGGVRSVEGRVRRPLGEGGDSTGMGPAVGTWVTLHRVGRDSAGPVDSVRSDAQGQYRLRWRAFGAADAVYFASVSWGGIAYFTAPLRTQNARGDEAEITVFDTTSRTFPLTVKGRHLIVGATDSANMRTIIEVFELSNDSLRTLVSPDGKAPAPTWSIGVPQAAQDVRVTEGEIAPDAFAYAAGRVSIFAPIAPGLKQVAFSYKLPAASFPIRVTAEHGAVVFEVLLEEPQGTVRGDGFTAVDPVTLENRNFKRFLLQDAPIGSDLIVELPTTSTPGRNLYIAGLLVAIGFLMLLVLSRAMQRRAMRAAAATAAPTLAMRHVSAFDRAPDSPLHERLAQEIAALDATFARQAAPSDSVRQAYDVRRRELKDALAEALASGGASR